MQCLKCGKDLKSTKCMSCGNDVKDTQIATIWKLSEEYIKRVATFSERNTHESYIGSNKDDDLQKLSEVEYETIKFGQGLYKGQIKNGKRNGYGIQYDNNNRTSYAGEWLDDKKSGYGKIYAGDGRCEFEGWFKNGLRHGKGLDLLPDGRSKESEWREGERISESAHSDLCIKTVLEKKCISANIETNPPKATKHRWDLTVLSNKDIELLSKTQKVQIQTATGEYVGDVKDGLRHGFGIQYDKSGHISYAGMWNNDKKHGKGRLYNQYGRCQFEGFFKFGYRDGAGIEFNEDGTTKESTWINGTRCT